MLAVLIFFLIAAAVVGGAVYLVVLVSKSNDDPLGQPNSTKSLNSTTQTQTTKPKKPFDWSKFFLSLGPVIAGLGVVGVVFQYWDDYSIQIKLSIAIVALLLVDIGGLVLFELGQRRHNANLLTIAKSLLILGSFLLGGVLFLIGQALELNDLNMQALLGLWFVGILPFTFMVRNAWQFGVNALVGIIFILNYFSFGINIGTGLTRVPDFLGFFGSLWFYYGSVFVFVLANIGLAGWLRFLETKPERKVSPLLKYGFRILAYLSLITAILTSIMTQYDLSVWDDSLSQIYLLSGGLVFFLIPLGVYLFLRPDKLAKIWWLPGLLVFLSGFVVFLNPALLSPFTGFYLLQVPLVLWVTLDYLQQRDVLTGILAYTTATVFYLIWSSGDSLFSSLALLIGAVTSLILIMRYTEKKDFVIYTWIAAGLAAFIKVLVLGLDASWVLLIAGLFLMLVGGYLLRLKSRSDKDKGSKEKIENNPAS